MEMSEAVQFVRDERQKQELKLEDIERVSYIANGTISRIETGMTPEPRFSTLQAIMEALGYKLELKITKIEN